MDPQHLETIEKAGKVAGSLAAVGAFIVAIFKAPILLKRMVLTPSRASEIYLSKADAVPLAKKDDITACREQYCQRSLSTMQEIAEGIKVEVKSWQDKQEQILRTESEQRSKENREIHGRIDDLYTILGHGKRGRRG